MKTTKISGNYMKNHKTVFSVGGVVYNIESTMISSTDMRRDLYRSAKALKRGNRVLLVMVSTMVGVYGMATYNVFMQENPIGIKIFVSLCMFILLMFWVYGVKEYRKACRVERERFLDLI